MGQYYTPLTQKEDDKSTRTSYTLKYKGEWSGYKLTEHSWWYNPAMNAFVRMLYHNPLRVAWVGDYSNDSPLCIEHHLYDDVFSKELRDREVELTIEELNLEGLYIINHSKKVYLDCSDYYNRCERERWCLHPLSLLTATGNGKGGGDYFGENREDVGAWAWDIISVENVIPVGCFNEVKYTFIDESFLEGLIVTE